MGLRDGATLMEGSKEGGSLFVFVGCSVGDNVGEVVGLTVGTNVG